MATDFEAEGPATASSTVTTSVISCPRCGNDLMQAVSDGLRTNFRCLLCWTCWHVELNAVSVVDVRSCPGCKYAHECQSIPLPSRA